MTSSNNIDVTIDGKKSSKALSRDFLYNVKEGETFYFEKSMNLVTGKSWKLDDAGEVESIGLTTAPS